MEKHDDAPKMPPWMEEMNTAFFDEDMKHPERIMPDVVSIGELLDSEKARVELEHLAYIDSLTGLLNRRGLDDQIEKMFAKRERPVALSGFSFDLNEFKSINDTYGHAVGDVTMQQWVALISNLLPRNALFARRGGDEFAALIPYSKKELALMRKNGTNVEQMTDEMGKMFADMMNGSILNSIKDGQKPVTAAVGGVCLLSPHTAEEVYHGIGDRSDEAMYIAKNSAKSADMIPRLHGLIPSTYFRRLPVEK